MEYDIIEKRISDLFENTKFAVLATADKSGVVSTAQMCLVNDGLKVYMQTDKKFIKVKNISENRNVAINIGPYNFRGTAKVIGHPKKHKKFLEKITAKHLVTKQRYTNLPDEVLIEIDLTNARIWGADNSKDIHEQETILNVDLKNKTVETVFCDKL